MPAVRIRVEGRVQGVGFRAFVMRLAREYHLRGEVWNSADGSVEGILQSDNGGNLERAVSLLKTGPGYVDKVESFPTEVGDFEGFSVSHRR
jgi:acylphosphatase